MRYVSHYSRIFFSFCIDYFPFQIKKALSYEYTSADVDKILEKKEKFSKFPVNYAMTKARLMKEKEIADAENDTEKAEELENKLKELEQRAEELDRRRTEKSSISSVSLINDRNRKRNVLKAEQAIQEEIKRKEVEGVEETGLRVGSREGSISTSSRTSPSDLMMAR